MAMVQHDWISDDQYNDDSSHTTLRRPPPMFLPAGFHPDGEGDPPIGPGGGLREARAGGKGWRWRMMLFKGGYGGGGGGVDEWEKGGNRENIDEGSNPPHSSPPHCRH
jgi:hypothetical protein